MTWEEGKIRNIPLGCEEIDGAHEAILQALLKLLKKGQRQEKLEREYAEAIDRFIDHCTIEEDIMRTLNWPGMSQHINSHRLIQRLICAFERPIVIHAVKPEIALSVLENLFNFHTNMEDKPLAEAWNAYKGRSSGESSDSSSS